MRIIDADGHVQEKQIPWADLLEEPYRSRAAHFGLEKEP